MPPRLAAGNCLRGQSCFQQALDLSSAFGQSGFDRTPQALT